MGEPTLTTIKKLFAASGNVCAYPGCHAPIVEKSGSITGEICHIKARNKNGPRFDPKQSEKGRHCFENLILLCGRHHKIIDKEPEVYDVASLLEMKKIHENYMGRKQIKEDSLFARFLLNSFKKIEANNNSGNIIIESPGAIQAKVVNIKSEKRKVKIQPPNGTIGANTNHRAYIEHLIKRYNIYASSDPTRKTKFNFGVLSTNISSKFGKKWKLIDMVKFQELTEYLLGRIYKTRQAKINKGKGHKVVSTFEQFLEKYK